MEQIKMFNKNQINHLSTYGLALFFFLVPFEYPLADLISISPLRIVSLLAMGLAVLDIFIQERMRFDYRFLYVLAWLLYCLITSFWAIDQARFQSYFSLYMNNALMFLLFATISFNKYETKILKKAMVCGVVALLLYMTFVPGAVIYSDYQNRLTLNAGKDGLDQNYLAALMLIAFGLVFYSFCNNQQKRALKVLSIVFCLAIAYYILLTGSRSGLISLLLIMLLNINMSWKTRLSIGVPVVLLLVVVFPIVAQYIPQRLLERFSLSALTGQESESGTRLVIWGKALESLQGVELLFGYGTGASQTIIGNVLENGMDMAIHNHYLAMLVEFGVIGFCLINYPILKMYKMLFKKDRAVAIGFTGILLMSFFVDVVTTKFFWSAMILLSVCFSVYSTDSIN